MLGERKDQEVIIGHAMTVTTKDNQTVEEDDSGMSIPSHGVSIEIFELWDDR